MSSFSHSGIDSLDAEGRLASEFWDSLRGVGAYGETDEQRTIRYDRDMRLHGLRHMNPNTAFRSLTEAESSDDSSEFIVAAAYDSSIGHLPFLG